MISVSSIANEQTLRQQIQIAQAADTRDSGASEPQSVPSGKWISNGEHLVKKWWKKRALKIKRALKLDTLPPEWLYHVEGQYSLHEETGNSKETDHKAEVMLSLRKGLVTSKTSFQIRDEEKGKGKRIRTKKKKVLNEFVYMELWDRVDIAGSLQWYTYDKRYIEDRYTGFAGLYFTLLDLPNYTLKLGTYYGYATISYMNDQIAQENPELSFPDYSSDLFFLRQRFAWSINDKLTFNQTGAYRQYLEDSDFVHWILNFDLDYELTKHISIVAAYEVDYESTELNQELRGLEKRDSEFDLKIKVSF
jgi:hypothetical protein